LTKSEDFQNEIQKMEERFSKIEEDNKAMEERIKEELAPKPE